MNHLFHELAPITEPAWEQIEDEATRSLRHFLAARKLIDVSPVVRRHFWTYCPTPPAKHSRAPGVRASTPSSPPAPCT